MGFFDDVPDKKKGLFDDIPSAPGVSPEIKPDENRSSTERTAGVAEGLYSFTSGLVGSTLGAIAAPLTAAGSMLRAHGEVKSIEEGKQLGEAIAKFFTYRPYTKTGQEMSDTLNAPFELIDEGLTKLLAASGMSKTNQDAAKMSAYGVLAAAGARSAKGGKLKPEDIRPVERAASQESFPVLHGDPETAAGHEAGFRPTVYKEWFEDIEPSEAAKKTGEKVDKIDQGATDFVKRTKEHKAAARAAMPKDVRETIEEYGMIADGMEENGNFLVTDPLTGDTLNIPFDDFSAARMVERINEKRAANGRKERISEFKPLKDDVPRSPFGPEATPAPQPPVETPGAASLTHKISGLLTKFHNWAHRNIGNKITIKGAPNMADAGLWDTANDHAYAREYPHYWTRDRIAQAFPDIYKNPDALNQLRDLMNKNRILGGYDRFVRRAKMAEEAGDQVGATKWRQMASNVEAAHDLKAYDEATKAAWEDPKFKEHIEGFKREIEPVLDQMYNEHRGADPNHELDTDGRYWKAHVSLVHAGEEGAWASHAAPEPEGPVTLAKGALRKLLGMEEPIGKGEQFTTRTGGTVKTNDYVKAPDRGNYGKVLNINKNRIAKVEFTNPDTKNTMVVDFPVDELESVSGPGASQGSESGVVPPYRNPDIQADPYARTAKFTGTYSTDMQESLAAVFGSRWNEITKIRLYNDIQAKGAGILVEEGTRQPNKLNGEKVHSKPVEFTVPKVDDQGRRTVETKRLWVQERIYGELMRVMDTADRVPRSKIGGFITNVQILSAADATAHIKNDIAVLAKSTGHEKAWQEMVSRVPFLGQAEAGRELWNLSREVVADTPEIRAEFERVARIGTFRARHTGTGITKPGHELIAQVDRCSRILMNRYFDNEVKAGRLVDTPENRRTYMNQLGMYNRRLMGPIMQFMKDEGFSAFIVAGRNFNVNMAKMLTGSPGAKTTGLKANLEIRAKIISGLVTATVVPFIINKATTGEFSPHGLPFGTIYLWKNEDDGSYTVLDAFGIGGWRRTFRVTGLGAIVEGLHQGHDINQIAGQATRDVGSSQANPWIGPYGRFVYEAATGKNIGTGRMQAHKVPEGGIKQNYENFRAATEAVNPSLYALADRPGVKREEGKTYLSEIFDALSKPVLTAVGKGKAYDPMSGAELKAYSYFRSKFGEGVTEDQETKFKFNQKMKEVLKDDPELGGDKLDGLIEQGKITRSQKKRLEKNASRARILVWIEGTEMDQALDVYGDVKKSGDKEMQILLADAIAKKFRHSRRSIPQEKREGYYDVVQGILDEADVLEGEGIAR